MNNKFLLFWAILTGPMPSLSAQLNKEFDYTKRIITHHHIKSITTWYFNERDTTGQDSVLNSIHIYDRKGNLLQYQPRMYSEDSSDFSRNYYEYDSNDNMVSTYSVMQGMYIIKAEDFFYNKNLLLEYRHYNTFKEFHFDERHLARTKTYYGDRNIYNREGLLISRSFCNFNPEPDTDSLMEKYDSNTRMTRLIKMKRIRPITDSVRCLRTIKYQYDNEGNLIRMKTSPGSNVFIDDSFAYDLYNNMVYRVNFNGDFNDNPRKKRDGKHTETFFENTYDSRGRLLEIKTYFHKDKQCFLRTSLEYDEYDTLRKKTVFKTYKEGSSCHDASSYYKLMENLPDKYISDTLTVEVYNKFGERTDSRTYSTGGSDREKQGALQYRDYHQTDSLGINQLVITFYGKTMYWNKTTPEKARTYRRYYTHYRNGLIRDIRQEKGNVLYRIVYTFY